MTGVLMVKTKSRFWEIFFDVYENLPRQGPGSRSCAARALKLYRDLPEFPVILDLVLLLKLYEGIFPSF